MSFVIIADGKIQVGLSETTEDRFEHGDGFDDYDGFKEFIHENLIELPCEREIVWDVVRRAFDSGASMVEYVVTSPH